MPIAISLNDNHWRASKVRLAKEDSEQELKALENDLLNQSPIDDPCTKNSHEDMNAIAANFPEIVVAESCNNGQTFMQHALNRTRKMTKAIRAVTTVLKCFNSCKQQALKATTSDGNSADKFHVAKLVLIRSAEIESFGNVLSKMR